MPIADDIRIHQDWAGRKIDTAARFEEIATFLKGVETFAAGEKGTWQTIIGYFVSEAKARRAAIAKAAEKGVAT